MCDMLDRVVNARGAEHAGMAAGIAALAIELSLAESRHQAALATELGLSENRVQSAMEAKLVLCENRVQAALASELENRVQSALRAQTNSSYTAINLR